MPTPRLVRWGAVGGLIAGLGWGASGVVAFVLAGGGEGPEGSLATYLIEFCHAIGEGGILLWLVGSHVRQAPGYGRLGMVGFVVSFVGTVLHFFVTLIFFLPYENFLTIVFSLGLLGWLVGFPLLGVATFRAKVLPRWCGLLLMVFFPLISLFLFFPQSFYGPGGILVGLLWLALGYALWSWRDVSAGQPSRVA
jgi:hypothetical protein